MAKKLLIKIFFSVITKNLNWEKIKHVNIMDVH